MSLLDDARIKINNIDEKMIELFKERMSAVLDVLKYKKEHNLPVFDEQREIALIKKNIELLQETKEKFIKELNQLLLDAEQCVMNLYDLCLDKLLLQIDYEFMKKHCIYLKGCNHKCLSDYLMRIGL